MTGNGWAVASSSCTPPGICADEQGQPVFRLFQAGAQGRELRPGALQVGAGLLQGEFIAQPGLVA